ncbi:MAG: NAD(+)/NADH kinase [Chloroflexi bacterium]|nr:NAD(+)/NADH kinase [Chloroflexota bacterium]
MYKDKLICLVYNPRIADAWKLTQAIIKSRGIHEESCWVASVEELETLATSSIIDTSLVITVGGDGTILRAVKLASPHRIPILGVNLGRIGFMTELRAEDALEKIPQYVNGDAWIEERTMLQARVVPGGVNGEQEGVLEGQPIHALNDVVVGRGTVARLIEIETRINGVALTTYRADGLIVSTATGSTGYALSVGGPILYPWAQDLLIKPVAAHLSFGTAMVLPHDSVIDLTILTDHQAMMSVDGFVDVPLSFKYRVQVKASPYVARFLRGHPVTHFYATLTQRLGLNKGNGMPGIR